MRIGFFFQGENGWKSASTRKFQREFHEQRRVRVAIQFWMDDARKAKASTGFISEMPANYGASYFEDQKTNTNVEMRVWGRRDVGRGVNNRRGRQVKTTTTPAEFHHFEHDTRRLDFRRKLDSIFVKSCKSFASI